MRIYSGLQRWQTWYWSQIKIFCQAHLTINTFIVSSHQNEALLRKIAVLGMNQPEHFVPRPCCILHYIYITVTEEGLIFFMSQCPTYCT
jgi:hypothetical protein